MKISEQVKLEMEVVSDIISKVRIMDSDAMVIGGAPRDWYMGNVCNDVDIYFHRSGAGATKVIPMLEQLGLKVVSVKQYTDQQATLLEKFSLLESFKSFSSLSTQERYRVPVKYKPTEYAMMEELWYILECEDERLGKPIQLMGMRRPNVDGDYRVIDSMACSLSKIYFTGETGIRPSAEFSVANKLKVNFWKPEYKCDNLYLKKITKRFPEYRQASCSHDNLTEIMWFQNSMERL